MTILEDRLQDHRPPAGMPGRTRSNPRTGGRSRPAPARPPIAALTHRGYRVYGLAVSCASHGPRGRRSVSATVTSGLAGLAALITLSLGLVAHVSGGPSPAEAASAERLAVVRVGAGESLQQLAGRIAPQAPAARVVARIQELNKLESPAVLAGQTLIAPVG